MSRPLEPIRFTRGRHSYLITLSYDGPGYLGLRDGRVVARASEPGRVARELIQQRQGN